MNYIIAIVVSYLIGSLSLSYFIAKFKGLDLRKEGSGNLGASNSLVIMGKTVGVLVALHDILKAVVAVVLMRYLFPNTPYIDVVAGISCILGHIFPFYLGFKGGKGFASYVGMTLALDWKVALALIVWIIVIVLITDYIVVGTISTCIIVPIVLGVLNQSIIIFAILFIPSIVMIFKHKQNYIRIMNGTEVGLRRANKGIDRKV